MMSVVARTFRIGRRALGGTVDLKETAKFEALARARGGWWDVDGEAAPLHRINPVRVEYILSRLVGQKWSARPLDGISLLDVGCGGGLLSESLARLGGSVLGVDAVFANIEQAYAHAHADPALRAILRYRHATTESLSRAGRQFDCVLALEIVEHVADVPLFLRECASLVKPGGRLIVSTLNRTHKSYFLGIVAAEYILRWVARGTHDWNKFITPNELEEHIHGIDGMNVDDITGLTFNPLLLEWQLNPSDTDVNYVMSIKKSSDLPI